MPVVHRRGRPATSADAGGGDAGTRTDAGRLCAPGYRCTEGSDPDVVWVMREEGNINGPTCTSVCQAALQNNCAYYACDQGREVEYPNIDSFAPIADGLGFACKPGGCWWPEAPGDGIRSPAAITSLIPTAEVEPQ